MSAKYPRRRFLLTGAVVGGGLLIGYGVSRERELLGAPALLPSGVDETALNAWLKIHTDGTVTVAIPRAEMGQGIYTALAMLVAEEMDIPWAQVRCIQAPVAKVYANVVMFAAGAPFDPTDDGAIATTGRWTFERIGRVLGIQATGGSSSVRDGWITMRAAGAAARDMLLRAGAERLAVKTSECDAIDGTVVHRASSRSVGYGDLAEHAARLDPPNPIHYKLAADYKLIGSTAARVDVADKVTGAAEYAIDVRLPDMLYAAVRACPVFGGSLSAVDDKSARSRAGVVDIVHLPDAVIVIADSYWRASQVLADLDIKFDPGPNTGFDQGALQVLFDQALAEDGANYENVGDAKATLTRTEATITAHYKAPFLAHTCMEPMNCTARTTATQCEIWSGNQVPTIYRDVAASVTGLDPDNIILHTSFMGGGFGRRAEIDVLTQALAASMAVKNRPVQLIWSREEDVRHDAYRPAAQARFSASVTESGRIEAWHNLIASPSVTQSYLKRVFPSVPAAGPDKTNAEGATYLPYEMPHRRVEHVAIETPVPVGYWRSVGHSFNAFFTECFIDELAAAAEQDPIEFRLAHLRGKARETRLLTMLAQHSNWGVPLPDSRARGVAIHESFGSIVGQVAEVEIIEGTVKVHRVVCVIDCGLAVHPDNVIAQMESSIIFGLTAALYGEISISSGQVEQSNFPDYRMLQLADSPQIETHIINSGGPIGGVGEPGTPPIAPAVANAVSSLTGRRIRTLPIRV